MIDIKKVKENFMYHKIFVVRLTQSVVQFLSWWAFCFYFVLINWCLVCMAQEDDFKKAEVGGWPKLFS